MDKQKLLEEKMKLVGMYNVIQEQIDAYGLDDIAVDSGPFKELCARKQKVQIQLKEINKILDN